MKASWILPLSALLFIGCNANQEIISETDQVVEEVASVIQPIAGLENSIQQFKVDGIKRDTIFLSNGGSIIFEENSFVDSDGKPIKGEVDVSWEEFHTLGDIIASGIPMKYDSAGVAFDLVSGGMFTISASQNQKPVEIAEGKSATVNMVSLQDTPCYNFYELDEKSGDWAYQTTKSGEVVEKEEEVADESAAANSIIDVELDTRKFIDLRNLDIVGWKTRIPISKGDKRWLTANYSNARLFESETEGWYLIEVKTADGTRKYDVEPYLMDEALADSKKNSALLEKEMEALVEYQRNLASGKVIRSIEIDGFGTYNWDIINKRENSLPLFANFDFPGKVDPRMVSLFLISPDENAVVKYDATGAAQFSFDPNLSNCLIAIMPDNSLMSVSDKGFNKARSLTGGSSCTFNFEKTNIKLKSPNDIMSHINALI
jgi:hypothetical protein